MVLFSQALQSASSCSQNQDIRILNGYKLCEIDKTNCHLNGFVFVIYIRLSCMPNFLQLGNNNSDLLDPCSMVNAYVFCDRRDKCDYIQKTKNTIGSALY